MRVISYGPGYEPKKIICEACKSEIEYVNADIQHHNSKVKSEDNNYKISFLHYLDCPVCGCMVVLCRDLIDTPKSPPPPPSAPPLRFIYERFRNKSK